MGLFYELLSLSIPAGKLPQNPRVC